MTRGTGGGLEWKPSRSLLVMLEVGYIPRIGFVQLLVGRYLQYREAETQRRLINYQNERKRKKTGH
jgi:hypothetical protein